MKNTIYVLKQPRKGCHDIWNAFMTKGAVYSHNDIPICPSTASIIPKGLIDYTMTKHISHPEFFVHFYIDDYKFDGKHGIWQEPEKALERLLPYAGVITPDFSTYQDMPEPLKIYNTFRCRAFGYWLTTQGIPVINNVRWGTPETYWYCFDGIPLHSTVAIGTVASGLREIRNRKRFETGLAEMVRRIAPYVIIVYGSSNYDCFDVLKSSGIAIITFPSKTASAFKERRHDE